MRDVLETIRRWRREGKDIAMATVVKASGSAPRREGARLLVSGDGEMVGSVSGGCVESDVLMQAQEVLKSGKPRLLEYAITDDMVWEVGLACGGAIEVLLEPLDETGNGEEEGAP